MRYKYLFIILIILFIVTVVYGICVTKKISFGNYWQNAKYEYVSYNDSKRMYHNLEETIIDSNNKSFDEIKDNTDYIFVIKVNNHILLGKSLINDCFVESIIKGDSLEEKNNIKIFDLVNEWGNVSMSYLGGSTPMIEGNRYIVFLNKISKNDNITDEDAYVFSNYKYSHININGNNYLNKYEQLSLTIKDIANYDYVFENCTDDEIIDYKKNIEKVYEMAKKY